MSNERRSLTTRREENGASLQAVLRRLPVPIGITRVSDGQLLLGNEQLRTASAALQTTSEALQATNKELQSTNAALETMHEGLLGTNETLLGFNTELHVRTDGLNTANAGSPPACGTGSVMEPPVVAERSRVSN